MALIAGREALAMIVCQLTGDQDTETSRVLALHVKVLDRDQKVGVVIEAVQRLNKKATRDECCATLMETSIREIDRKTVDLPRLIADFTQRVAEWRAYVAGLVDDERLGFRMVVSLAWLATKVCVTEANDAFADEVPVSTSCIAADTSSRHAL